MVRNRQSLITQQNLLPNSSPTYIVSFFFYCNFCEDQYQLFTLLLYSLFRAFSIEMLCYLCCKIHKDNQLAILTWLKITIAGYHERQNGTALQKEHRRIEHLNSHVEQQSIQWRRDKVQELSSQGNSQREISKILQVGIGTVNRDLSYLRQQAKENIRSQKFSTIQES